MKDKGTVAGVIRVDGLPPEIRFAMLCSRRALLLAYHHGAADVSGWVTLRRDAQSSSKAVRGNAHTRTRS